MAKITFNDYLSDVLDLHEGLMSSKELSEARESYKAFIAPAPKAPQHRCAKMKLPELEVEIANCLKSKEYYIEKCNKAGTEAPEYIKRFVAHAKAKLSMKHTKNDILALLTENSEISRQINK